MKRTTIVLAALVLAQPALARDDSGADLWNAYLDYAYVYCSADSEALQMRLDEYAEKAGVTLERHLAQTAVERQAEQQIDEVATRRRAIGQLLVYLASGAPQALDTSVEAVRQLEGRLGRHENRYWYHYVLAHYALERGRPLDFVGEIFELWLKVVTPLEAPFETLQTLSLGDSPNSGFVPALPHLYENIARVVLIRSQQMGVNSGLDPLAAIVRMLHDGRVGAHPDVVPRAASSIDYVERIVERLNGPESDAGSLSFTLSLFEANLLHDRARGLLATEAFSSDAIKAVRVASAAYESALAQADTAQGQAAVYRRVLRQIGEVYVAKQRLGVDPQIETPFSIEGAIDVYRRLHDGGSSGSGWEDLGYRKHGREAYVGALHRLWEEIQETSLNAADYYFSQAIAKPHLADEHARNAARVSARYLDFFHRYAAQADNSLVPDSAYFAAYEAARGFGDAFLVYAAGSPSETELALATRRYRLAIGIFPFDPHLWPSLASALERQGRESEYLLLGRPLAERFAGSRSLEGWIRGGEYAAEAFRRLRRALSDDLVIMYLGFADSSGLAGLEQSAKDLRVRRGTLTTKLAQLERQRRVLRSQSSPPAAPQGSAEPGALEAADSIDVIELGELREVEAAIGVTRERIAETERQLAARSRALPLYRSVLETGDLTDGLRADRQHPVHKLLRRLYQEGRTR